MTGKYLSHIIGFLNSSVITWYFHNCLGARSGAGTNRWLKYTIELLPIPPVCDVITNLIGNKNTITERDTLKINELCMDLFTLDEEEKAIIRVKLTYYTKIQAKTLHQRGNITQAILTFCFYVDKNKNLEDMDMLSRISPLVHKENLIQVFFVIVSQT